MTARHHTRLLCSAGVSATGRAFGTLSWRAACRDCGWESARYPVAPSAAEQARWDAIAHEVAPRGADDIAGVLAEWKASR